MGGQLSAPKYTITGTGSGWPTFRVPILGLIDTDPYKLPMVQPMFLACREVVLWFFCYWFLRRSMADVRAYLQTLMIMPQVDTSRGEDSRIPLWDHIKGTLSTLGIMGIAIGAYAAAVLLVNTHATDLGGWAWNTLVGKGDPVAIAGSSFGNFGPIVTVMLDFFPFGAAISLLVGYIGLQVGMAKIFFVATQIVRAIRV
jgi:hypothetical protein